MTLATPAAFLALLLSAAIFGFFYAWTCSTMWGLDAADPRVAMAAMQAMNASVRNAVFAPAFFGTPVALALAALFCLRAGAGQATSAFGAAATVSLVGGLILTMVVNVPMNEALAQQAVPPDTAEAAVIWEGYSARWQVFNQIRTVASGAALLLAGWGMFALGRAT